MALVVLPSWLYTFPTVEFAVTCVALLVDSHFGFPLWYASLVLSIGLVVFPWCEAAGSTKDLLWLEA